MNKHLIRKLADFVLLNAYSVDSTGLFNGKAGFSLTLFEASRLLNNEYLEDQAFELLQISLLSKNRDIRFENGLSGIGFVFNYLIENQFIDAEFDEFFSDTLKKIITGLEKEINKNQHSLSVLSTVRFLEEETIQSHNSKIKELQIRILDNVYKYLYEHFNKIEQSSNSDILKEELRKLYLSYLQSSFRCTSGHDPSSLLEKYIALCDSNRMACNFPVGYYMYRTACRTGNEELINASRNQMDNGIKNIRPESLLLVEKMQLSYMLENAGIAHPVLNHLPDSLLSDDEEKVEQHILKQIPSGAFIAGYETGISRLLLWLAYHENKTNPRFEKLFI